MKKLLGISACIFLVLLGMPVFADYEVFVFQEYDKTYTVSGDTLTVEMDLVLRNVGNTPVIPGEISFRTYEIDGGSTVPSEINEVLAQDNTGEIDSRVEESDEYSELIVHIWNPILPGFDHPISIEYEIDFSPSGILFNEVVFPIEETTIPIQDSSTEFLMPRRNSVTFAPDAEVTSDSLNTIVSWDRDRDLMLEYTILPLPRMPFRMVSVFWLSILMILGVVFIYLNSRRPDKR